MRSPPGLVAAAAIWLFANTAAAQASGAIIAESAHDFSQPHDVVLSPNGAFLYVADVGTDSIKVLDPSTLITLGAFGADRLSGPHDVAFDQRGRLLVADTHNHRIAVRRAKAPSLSGWESRPATVAPAGSSRSGRRR